MTSGEQIKGFIQTALADAKPDLKSGLTSKLQAQGFDFDGSPWLDKLVEALGDAVFEWANDKLVDAVSTGVYQGMQLLDDLAGQPPSVGHK